jgi:hypothetical protein
MDSTAASVPTNRTFIFNCTGISLFIIIIVIIIIIISSHIGALHCTLVCVRQAAMLAEGLDTAIMKFLENQKTPSRKVGEMDNRCSSFWLALYWAEALAQSKDVGLKLKFFELHQKLLVRASNKLKKLQPLDFARPIRTTELPDFNLIMRIIWKRQMDRQRNPNGATRNLVTRNRKAQG